MKLDILAAARLQINLSGVPSTSAKSHELVYVLHNTEEHVEGWECVRTSLLRTHYVARKTLFKQSVFLGRVLRLARVHFHFQEAASHFSWNKHFHLSWTGYLRLSVPAKETCQRS